MAKKQDEQPQQTMEDYLLAQLNEEVILKDGTQLKAADGRRETERFADIVEQARLYILTDCGGSFERFAEWGLIRAQE